MTCLKTGSKALCVGLLLLAVCRLPASANDPGHLIVGYDFDDALQEVGPDTYQIFKHTHGKIGLSQAYKFSGWRSLKIQDVARDGGFPDLQGCFKTIAEGRLYFHFALGFESSKWQERAADAAFYSKDYEVAIEHYLAALKIAGGCNCSYLKLADIYHLKGDAGKEREYREMIYGRFEEIY